MLKINKNNTLFPDFMKIELCKELVAYINNIVEPYKNNIKDAVIYSLNENKTIKSERRVSHKASFNSPILNNTIVDILVPLIYQLLKTEYPNVSYDIMIGEQSFDYIKYDNGGYFDKHKDFIRVNNNMHQQYTMLIGLTKDNNMMNSGGSTILWFPVDKNSIYYSDYNILVNEDINSEGYKTVAKKYNLLYKNDIVQSLREKSQLYNNVENLSFSKYIPYVISCYKIGEALLFRSDIIHSGEEFYSWYNAKELFMFTINITGINIPSNNQNLNNKINNWLNDKQCKIICFDEFENFMPLFVTKYNLIPFQIIISSGEYNYKKFSDTYIKYLNLQNDFIQDINSNILERINVSLVDIYSKTKNKLNKRGREEHISSTILEESTIISKIEKLEKINFNTNHIDFTMKYIRDIKHSITNYVNNFILINNGIITHNEKINNTWEESTCNDDGDEYDDVTYLNCKIDIKFCFIKI